MATWLGRSTSLPRSLLRSRALIRAVGFRPEPKFRYTGIAIINEVKKNLLAHQGDGNLVVLSAPAVTTDKFKLRTLILHEHV